MTRLFVRNDTISALKSDLKYANKDAERSLSEREAFKKEANHSIKEIQAKNSQELEALNQQIAKLKKQISQHSKKSPTLSEMGRDLL